MACRRADDSRASGGSCARSLVHGVLGELSRLEAARRLAAAHAQRFRPSHAVLARALDGAPARRRARSSAAGMLAVNELADEPGQLPVRTRCDDVALGRCGTVLTKLEVR